MLNSRASFPVFPVLPPDPCFDRQNNYVPRERNILILSNLQCFYDTLSMFSVLVGTKYTDKLNTDE